MPSPAVEQACKQQTCGGRCRRVPLTANVRPQYDPCLGLNCAFRHALSRWPLVLACGLRLSLRHVSIGLHLTIGLPRWPAPLAALQSLSPARPLCAPRGRHCFPCGRAEPPRWSRPESSVGPATRCTLALQPLSWAGPPSCPPHGRCLGRCSSSSMSIASKFGPRSAHWPSFLAPSTQTTPAACDAGSDAQPQCHHRSRTCRRRPTHYHGASCRDPDRNEIRVARHLPAASGAPQPAP